MSPITRATLSAVGALAVATLAAGCAVAPSPSNGAPDAHARAAVASDFTPQVTILNGELTTLIADLNTSMINMQAASNLHPNWSQCYVNVQNSIVQQFQTVTALRPQMQTLIANESGSSDAESVAVGQMRTALDAAQVKLDGNNASYVACGGPSDYLLNGGSGGDG